MEYFRILYPHHGEGGTLGVTKPSKHLLQENGMPKTHLDAAVKVHFEFAKLVAQFFIDFGQRFWKI